MRDIILAVISCGVLNVIATAIINRRGRLKIIEEKLDKIEKRQEKQEKDELRTQLLLMVSDYPDNQEGIMAIAQRYFGELYGNWYATSLFNHWLEDKHIAKPEWFKED